MKTKLRQAVTLQSMEVHGAAGGCPNEAVSPWEALARADSWQDLWTSGERSPCWSRFAGSTCRPVEREAHAGAGLLAALVTPWGTHTGSDTS